MVRRIIPFLLLLFGVSNTPGPSLSSSEIFTKNKDAVVQIFADNELSGCGFIVSPDGLIMTANHVVTTEKSDFTEIYGKIQVKKIGERLHTASVISHSKVSDTAILRIVPNNLPYVTLGSTEPLQPSNSVTMITFLPDSRTDAPLLVTGTVSGKGALSADAIILQMPIRKGFSGSPVFDSDGRVVGIVSTRLVGISRDLEMPRKQLRSGLTEGHIDVLGANLPPVLLGLIDSLDADLVSGLGSAVDISYGKKMLEEAKGKN